MRSGKLKTLFTLLVVVGLAASAIACAWFRWWIAAPVSLALGASLQYAGDQVLFLLRRRRSHGPPVPWPRPRAERLVYRLKL